MRWIPAFAFVAVASAACAHVTPPRHGEEAVVVQDDPIVEERVEGPVEADGREPTPDWPRREVPAVPASDATDETPLGKKICVGRPGPRERPHRAACCHYPRDFLVRPLKAATPALRACYEARTQREARGRVSLSFRIEQDGSIAHVCANEATTMLDEDALRCILGEIRRAHYPPMSDGDVDLCGLMTLNYPVVFEP
jgi:hypothetical protein